MTVSSLCSGQENVSPFSSPIYPEPNSQRQSPLKATSTRSLITIEHSPLLPHPVAKQSSYLPNALLKLQYRISQSPIAHHSSIVPAHYTTDHPQEAEYSVALENRIIPPRLIV